MAEQNKALCNDRETKKKKKMVVKIGGGGVGIGAVILFGGALATAALASAFIVGKRGRSSGSNIRRKSGELQNEHDEANKGEQLIFHDVHKPPSRVATDEVELEKDSGLLVSAKSFILVEKPGTEINGGTPGEQILCSVSSQKQEKDTNGSVILEEEINSFEPKSMMHEANIQLNGECVTNEISKVRDGFKEIYIDREIMDGEYNGAGEIKEISREEVTIMTRIQNSIGETTDKLCDQKGSELTVFDKPLENGHIDEMEAQKNMQMKVIMDVKELDAIHGGNKEIISEAKCEEVIKKNKLEVAAVGDGELEVINHMEAAKMDILQPREEGTTEACFNEEEIEVTVTEHAVKGVHIDQVEAGENSSMEVNNEEKQSEGCWSDDGEVGEVKCREAIEEGLELSEGGTCGNQEAISSDISAPETIQDGQETEQPVVERPVSEHRNVDGDKEEVFVSTEVAEKSKEGISGNDEAILSHSTSTEKLVSESYMKDPLLPACESPLIEHENLEDGEVECAIPSQNVETVQEEITVGGQEEQVKHIEEQLVTEQKDHDQTDKEIVPEKCEEVGVIDETEGGQEEQVKHIEEQLVTEQKDHDQTDEEIVPKKFEKEGVIDKTEEGQEEQVKHIEEQLVTEQKDHDQTDEEIVPEKCEEVGVMDETEGGQEEQIKHIEEQLVTEQKDHDQTDEEIVPEKCEEVGVIDETGGAQEEQVKQIEEQLVTEQKDHDQTDEEIVPEKCEEVGLMDEANQSFLQSDQQVEVNAEKLPEEENACTDNLTTEDWHFGDKENNVQVLVESMLTEQQISPEKVEGTEEDAANEEVAEGLEVNENETVLPFDGCQQKDHNDDPEENITEETEDSAEIIGMSIAKAADAMSMETIEDEEKSEEDDTKEYDIETDLSDEGEESSIETGDSSMESNSEAVWPAELLQEPSKEPQQGKPIEQEKDGKIQENTAIEEEDDSQDRHKSVEDSYYQPNQLKAAEGDLPESTESSTIMADSKGNIKRTKYQLEMASLRNHMTNSTRWRVLIAMLSVLSSLSCSWFFGLSFVKLCLIVFFTMVLSKIHGY